jgi:predicted DNA-binding transcriptional regulator AlpA
MAELLTTRQVQELLHVDRTTIYRLVASDQLPWEPMHRLSAIGNSTP